MTREQRPTILTSPAFADGDGLAYDAAESTPGSPRFRAQSGTTGALPSTLGRAEYRTPDWVLMSPGEKFVWQLKADGHWNDLPLDLTAPTDPTITADGIYAVSGLFTCRFAQPGKHFEVTIGLDDDDFGWALDGTSPLEFDSTSVSLAMTIWLAEGAVIRSKALGDFDPDTEFLMTAAVQTVSLG